MNQNLIIVKNAHTNNLKNIDIEIPKHKLVVFTGVSGSGKSSLLFDTIYTEAQRQLIETFSTFARTRMPKLSRPDVDDILNLSTAIVIDQKRMGNNLRSTVGTATEVNTYGMPPGSSTWVPKAEKKEESCCSRAHPKTLFNAKGQLPGGI